VIGPKDDFPTPGVTTTLRLSDDAPPAPHNAMMYTIGNAPQADAALTTEATKTSVVVLRRLANPYLPGQPNPAAAGYNPYITVDFVENIPTRDRAEFDSVDRRGGHPFASTNLASVGRQHPYAAAPLYGSMAPTVSALADQTVMPPPATPAHTFFGANSNLDNAAGLAWLAHLDREPVNQLELLHVSVASPALLTQQFFTGTPGIYQSTPYTTGGPTPILLGLTAPGVERVLDLLCVGSRLPGVPLGGREPGRVNINTAGDPAILQAVLDPQTGDTFALVPAPGFVANVWPQLLASRTATPGTPSTTVFELNASNAPGTDRPFQPGGQLFADTLFRQGAMPNVPALFNTAAGNHLYMQAEPLRKGWNNLTTVSDGFLVVFTVGFFEVDGAGRLGQELKLRDTGDLRAQYAAIVDRSAITMNIADPTSATPLAVQPNVLGPKPWETKLAGDSLPGSNSVTIQANFVTGNTFCTVFDDGQQVNIDATGAAPTANLPPVVNRTSQLWIGYAMANPTSVGYPAGTPDGDGEAVLVTGVTAGTIPGTAVLTVQTVGGGNLTRFHGGGGRVSNAPVGHPGPQPLFDYRNNAYRGVLPFFMRMVP
jgi:hypothetical protein